MFGGFDSLDGRKRRIVAIEYWREKAYKVIPTDGLADKAQALKRAFARARNKLFSDGFIAEFDGHAWRIFD